MRPELLLEYYMDVRRNARDGRNTRQNVDG
jgi:hypothetical protein